MFACVCDTEDEVCEYINEIDTDDKVIQLIPIEWRDQLSDVNGACGKRATRFLVVTTN